MFLLDGSPIYNIDEIPQGHTFIAVSFRPFMRNRRLFFSLGSDQSYDEGSTTLYSIFKPSNIKEMSSSLQRVSRTNASIEAKLYLDDRDKRHMAASVSKEIIHDQLKLFGSDILKEESFY